MARQTAFLGNRSARLTLFLSPVPCCSSVKLSALIVISKELHVHNVEPWPAPNPQNQPENVDNLKQMHLSHLSRAWQLLELADDTLWLDSLHLRAGLSQSFIRENVTVCVFVWDLLFASSWLELITLLWWIFRRWPYESVIYCWLGYILPLQPSRSVSGTSVSLQPF